MDVNNANSVAAVHSDGRQHKQGREHPPGSENNKDDSTSTSGSWREQEAVQFDHQLIDALTPEIQQMIDTLIREIEPLRRNISIVEQQLKDLRAHTARHSFIDIPSQSAMLRDLEHVISNKEKLSISPVFVLINITNGDQVRQQHGRNGRESFLVEFCARVAAKMQSSDTFGSLGGNDFGLILFGTDLAAAQQALDTLSEEVTKDPVQALGHDVMIEMASGAIDLQYVDSKEAAIYSVDRLVCHNRR